MTLWDKIMETVWKDDPARKMPWHEMDIRDFEEDVRRNPDDPFVHNKLAMLYEHTNRFGEAIKEFEEALKCFESGNFTKRGYYGALWDLTFCYEQEGQYGLALENYNRIRELFTTPEQIEEASHTTHLFLILCIANSLERVSRYDEALTDYNQALEMAKRPKTKKDWEDVPGGYDAFMKVCAVHAKERIEKLKGK